MTLRVAADTNAAIDYLRPDRTAPPDVDDVGVALPLPVLGELFAGAFASRFQQVNLKAIEELANKWTVVQPTAETARIYGRFRAREAISLTPGKINDLWIAALCIEHDLPLLTNDRGFDLIPDLKVVHW